MARNSQAEFDSEPPGDAEFARLQRQVRSPIPHNRRQGDGPRSPIPFESSEKDALLDFGTETERKPKWASVGRSLPLSTRVVGVAVAIGLTAAVVAYMWMQRSGVSVSAGAANTNTTIDSRPSGANVIIDGVARGVTPLKLSLAAGPHSVQLIHGALTRTIPLSIEPRTVVSQYIEIAPPPSPAERLEVTSDPPGGQVTVDKQLRGVTPLILEEVGAGQHEVVVSTGESRVRRVVQIKKGATASVFVSLQKTGAAAGWIAMKSPIELQILEGGKLLGTSSADQIMLPVGRHKLELANDAYGFRTTMTLAVVPGKVAAQTVPLPKGSLSVNALPWAEVWLDGKSVGTTPLANLSVPIGTHELVLRHPQFPERQQTVTITTRTPTRVGLDLAK